MWGSDMGSDMMGSDDMGSGKYFLNNFSKLSKTFKKYFNVN
jgi:hypothetical protein